MMLTINYSLTDYICMYLCMCRGYITYDMDFKFVPSDPVCFC